MRSATRSGTRLLLRHGNPRGLPHDVIDRIHRVSRDRAAQRAVLRLYRATDMAAVSEDLHRRLRHVDPPVLVVWGRRDPYLPVEYAERQRETFPRAQVVLLGDSGHGPMIDNPVVVEQAVLPFLRSATSASGGQPTT